MAGATLEFDNSKAMRTINSVARQLESPSVMFRDMGEFLMIVHGIRFKEQQSPDGIPWKALSPRYAKRKKKNKDKILILDGPLSNTLRYQVDDNELLFGSDRPYAAIQHHGGEIKMPARSQTAYFKRNRDGSVGNQFVKKSKSNFAQDVTVGAYTIRIPARPWLGTSEKDDDHLVEIALGHLRKAAGA